MTRTVSPGRHRPVMALTRAMAAKLASQSSNVDRDVTTSPQLKISPRHRYPSSSSSSSLASSSSTFSPARTPMNLFADSPQSISVTSQFKDFVQHVSSKFHDMFEKIEHISNRMSNIEESICDQRCIINELEREISIIADRLNKISSSSLKRSAITPSSVITTLHKGTQTNDNYRLTSFPRIISPRTSNPQSLRTSQSPHPPRSIDFDNSAPAPKSPVTADRATLTRPATYWRSAPSSRPAPHRSEDPRSPAPNPILRSKLPSGSVPPLRTSTIPRDRAPPTRSNPTRNSSLPTHNLVLPFEHHFLILSPSDQPA